MEIYGQKKDKENGEGQDLSKVRIERMVKGMI